MKKFLPFLASLMLASVSWGQTGNGVILLTDASYTFTPTTVDSSATFNLSLKNDVGIAQTMFFGGLEAPFQLSNDGPIEVASQDTIDFSITFTPSDIGSFSDTLEVIGNVFGSASLVVSGDGAQVQLEWTPDTLAFDTTAIGQTNSQTLALSSVGDGAAVISSIDFSNDIFSVDSALSSFNIAEGSTENIVVNYAPVNAGAVDATMTLHTNDPTNATIDITLSAVGISEVSGDLCDITWTLINSPYTLVGDVVVPEGCALTIEPGVEVNGEDFTIIAKGDLVALGTETSPIEIEVKQMTARKGGTIQLTHAEIFEFSSLPDIPLDLSLLDDFEKNNFDSLITSYQYLAPTSNENPDIIGFYSENFNDNNAQGWSNKEGYPVAITSISDNYSVYGDINTSNTPSVWIKSPIFSINPGEKAESMSVLFTSDWWSGCNGSASIVATINDEHNVTLINFDSSTCEPNPGQSLTFDLSQFASDYDVSSIQFTFNGAAVNWVWVRVDNFEFQTSFFTTNEASASNFSLRSLSTGDVTLANTSWHGSLYLAAPQLTLTASNSGISPFFPELPNCGVYVTSDNAEISLSSAHISDFSSDGLKITKGSGVNIVSIDGSSISQNSRNAVTAGKSCNLQISHTLLRNNGNLGISLDSNSGLEVSNCDISGNGSAGIESASPAILDHSNIAFNSGTGLVLTGNNFHTLNNSILWGNNSSNYTQIDIGGGVISTSYSTVQGRSSYGTTGSGQYYWGEGVIEADPLFADNDLHLEIFSPCVDGGQPWHQDAYMPFGLGGVRADMGMYGGPDNAYWGGEALPDGASALTGVSDSPQDQGGVVGLVFDASFYDNSDLVNNVTSYAFWRHYDPTGQSIGTLDEGNWELIGEMPAQSFNGYAYQAQTLGNTNAFGTFNSCYTVVAQTDDPDTYWYSNVLCGESVDNLAPVEPELEGMVLETGGVTVFWELPSEEDYAYTEVTSDAGFTAEVTGDTLAVDVSAELGGTYTYTAVHYDVNGNASDPASLTLALEPGVDVITLNAGWNLISMDRAVTQGVDEVFAGLAAGNLQYVTGFDGGVQFYDPNGLSFLNTLGSLTPGNGYWVKVAADDVLEVSGVRLAEDFMPGLAEGWNLVGYAAEAPAAPGDVYADLVAAGDILYVTGFDEGVQVYDPNGLPFLNTLTEMRNGFGYWVKSAVATDGDVLAPLAGDVLPAEMPTPRYDVVNGVSELGAYAGEFVDVVNRWGTTVARLSILEGGHLMTTALFGDDPATGAVEGLADGEELHFAFRGSMANETLVFGGDMTHKTLSLTFDEIGAAMSVFPNPATEETTIRFGLSQMADVVVTMRDVQGREVMAVTHAGLLAGEHALPLALEELQAGTYTLEVNASGVALGSTRVMVME